MCTHAAHGTCRGASGGGVGSTSSTLIVNLQLVIHFLHFHTSLLSTTTLYLPTTVPPRQYCTSFTSVDPSARQLLTSSSRRLSSSSLLLLFLLSPSSLPPLFTSRTESFSFLHLILWPYLPHSASNYIPVSPPDHASDHTIKDTALPFAAGSAPQL